MSLGRSDTLAAPWASPHGSALSRSPAGTSGAWRRSTGSSAGLNHRRACSSTSCFSAPTASSSGSSPSRDSSGSRQFAEWRVPARAYPQVTESPRQRGRAGRGHEALRDPVVHVDEAIERRPLEDTGVVERAAVELHVGEVLEEHVVRLGVGVLELLPGQDRSMLAGRRRRRPHRRRSPDVRGPSGRRAGGPAG